MKKLIVMLIVMSLLAVPALGGSNEAYGGGRNVAYGPKPYIMLTVASDYAPDAVKWASDYVCDGAADEVEINLAIDALSTSGTHMSGQPIGRVQLVGGEFTITTPILMSGGVTLAGENPVGTIVFCALASGAEVTDDYNAVEFKSGITSYQYAQVVDLAFWGYADGFDGGTRTESQGINLDHAGASNCKVINCRLKGFNGTSVYLFSSSYGCAVVDTLIWGYGGSVEGSIGIRGGNLIQGCVITDCDNALYAPDNGARIIGNLFEHCGKAAIVSNTSDCIYIGNLFEGSNEDTAQGNATIYLTGGSYNTFIGNQIHCSHANEDYGILSTGASDYTIAVNNTITGADTADILLAGDNNIYDNASNIPMLANDHYSSIKTVIKTIDLDDDASTDDFQFDDDAGDSLAQDVDLGTIVPAWAEIISVQLRCFESVGAGTFQVTLGNASAGTQLLAQATVDAANEFAATAATAGPVIATSATAQNVWIRGDPSGAWTAAGDAGRWAVMVTYIDYGAVYTVEGP